MLTVVETPTFQADAKELWTEEERGAFCSFIAASPEAGNVIPGSGGCRKIRWSRAGMGKRGGVRIIYFVRLRSGQVWLLTMYTKNETSNIPAHILRAIREEIDDG